MKNSNEEVLRNLRIMHKQQWAILAVASASFVINISDLGFTLGWW